MLEQYLKILTTISITAITISLILFTIYLLYFLKKDLIDNYILNKSIEKKLREKIDRWENRVRELEDKIKE